MKKRNLLYFIFITLLFIECKMPDEQPVNPVPEATHLVAYFGDRSTGTYLDDKITTTHYFKLHTEEVNDTIRVTDYSSLTMLLGTNEFTTLPTNDTVWSIPSKTLLTGLYTRLIEFKNQQGDSTQVEEFQIVQVITNGSSPYQVYGEGKDYDSDNYHQIEVLKKDGPTRILIERPTDTVQKGDYYIFATLDQSITQRINGLPVAIKLPDGFENQSEDWLKQIEPEYLIRKRNEENAFSLEK